MKRFYLTTFVLLFLSSCATYKAKYAEQDWAKPNSDKAEPIHTFYLIGDAGKSPIGDMNTTLKAFKKKLDDADKTSTAIFLGDNIYPAGFPDKKEYPEKHAVAKNHLRETC